MPKAQAPTNIKESSASKHLVGARGGVEVHLRPKGGIELRSPADGALISSMSLDEARRLSRLLLAAVNRAKYDSTVTSG